MTLADKLDYLMRHTYKPDGKLYTYAEIVDASNGRLTISHISQMRRGTRTNPSMEAIQALAEVFGVDPSYFFDANLTNPPADLKQVDEDVIRIALRAQELGPEDRTILHSLIERLRRDKEAP